MPDKDITINGTFTVNYYKVTYTVDGKIYATDNIAYGSKITLINIPTKAGYTFSGWSEAPETMPAEDITISGTFTLSVISGDVNEDGKVSISDIVTVVNYSLAKSTKVFNFTAADVTNDKKISITDVVGILNIILTTKVESNSDYYAKPGIIVRSSDYLSMSNATLKNSCLAIPICLNNSNEYTAFQMDVELPEGAKLTSATLGSRAASSHSITWSNIGANKARVVAYSLRNKVFAGNSGELVTLNIETADGTTGTVAVDNICMATAEGVETAIGGCGTIIDGNGTTGIDAIDGNMFKVYTADGALVVESGKDMQLPVYSINTCVFFLS